VQTSLAVGTTLYYQTAYARPGSSCPDTPLPLTRVCVSAPDAAFAVDNDKGDEMDHACLAIFCVIFMSSSCLFGHAQLSAELASACGTFSSSVRSIELGSVKLAYPACDATALFCCQCRPLKVPSPQFHTESGEHGTVSVFRALTFG